MARKPNYDFERRERERLKSIKVAEKAEAKRQAAALPGGPHAVVCSTDDDAIAATEQVLDLKITDLRVRPHEFQQRQNAPFLQIGIGV